MAVYEHGATANLRATLLLVEGSIDAVFYRWLAAGVLERHGLQRDTDYAYNQLPQQQDYGGEQSVKQEHLTDWYRLVLRTASRLEISEATLNTRKLRILYDTITTILGRQWAHQLRDVIVARKENHLLVLHTIALQGKTNVIRHLEHVAKLRVSVRAPVHVAGIVDADDYGTVQEEIQHLIDIFSCNGWNTRPVCGEPRRGCIAEPPRALRGRLPTLALVVQGLPPGPPV